MLSDEDKKILDKVMSQFEMQSKNGVDFFSINLEKYPKNDLQEKIKKNISPKNWCALFGVENQIPYISFTKMDNIPYQGKQT